MIKFYYNLAPNPMKVALFLEEANLAYELQPIDTRKGEQHTPEYRAINPKVASSNLAPATNKTRACSDAGPFFFRPVP